jgi:hypothetical protein
MSLSVHFLFLMVTIKLARGKRTICFHSPSSPHINFRSGWLKKIYRKMDIWSGLEYAGRAGLQEHGVKQQLYFVISMMDDSA